MMTDLPTSIGPLSASDAAIAYACRSRSLAEDRGRGLSMCPLVSLIRASGLTLTNVEAEAGQILDQLDQLGKRPTARAPGGRRRGR